MKNFLQIIEVIFGLIWPILIVALIIFIKNRKKYIKIIDKRIHRKEYEEMRRKKEAAEKRRKEEEAKRRKQNYLSHLPSVYNKYSTQELQKIYDILRTMFRNDYHVGEEEFSSRTSEIYFVAKNQLCDILGYPKNVYHGGHPFANYCIFAELDMNYVYRLLRSRGVEI